MLAEAKYFRQGRFSVRSLCRLVAFAVALVPAAARPLAAATLNVASGVVDVDAGDSRCSLIEAFENAEDTLSADHSDCVSGSRPGPDTIVLATGAVYLVADPHNFWFGPNGLPSVQSAITVEGRGARIERASAVPFRFFHIGRDFDGSSGESDMRTGTLVLRDLTLSNGFALGGSGASGLGAGGGGGGLGGAFFNQGVLTLERVTVVQNRAQGGLGGFVGAGFGGGGGIGGAGDRLGGGGAFLPAFNSADGAHFVGGEAGRASAAGAGAGGESAFGGEGGNGAVGGGGGGDFAADGTAATADAGGVGGPGGGRGGDPVSDGYGGGGGAFAGGGGAGHAGGGGGGVGGGGGASCCDLGGGGGFAGGGGGGLRGGGSGGVAGGGGGTLAESGGSGGFAGGHGGSAGGGGGGLGGGIFNQGGRVLVVNSTLTANAAIGGAGGSSEASGSPGLGGSGFGGAIFNLDGDVSLVHATIAGNDVAAGAGGSCGLACPPANAGTAAGGAYYQAELDLAGDSTAAVVLRNSILADSTGGVDCSLLGGTASGSGNLVESNDGTGCPGVATSSDPRLNLLGDYGGLTPSMPLLPGSPAIDTAVDCSLALEPLADQRGVARPVDGDDDGTATCDVGAFERSGSVLAATKVAVRFAAPGELIRYTIEVTNQGPGALSRIGRKADDRPSHARGRRLGPATAVRGAGRLHPTPDEGGSVDQTHSGLGADGGAGRVSRCRRGGLCGPPRDVGQRGRGAGRTNARGPRWPGALGKAAQHGQRLSTEPRHGPHRRARCDHDGLRAASLPDRNDRA
jgi:hypothetical protein